MMNPLSAMHLMRRTCRSLAACLLLVLCTAAHAAPNWGQKTPANAPTDLSVPGMAFDAVHGQLVLFLADETWVFGGNTWIKKTPATSPSKRQRAALTYDPVRRQVLLFGGVETGTGNRLVDTWVWDGDNWTQKFPATVPVANPNNVYFNLLTFDAAHGEALLVMDGTWTWNGSDWSLVSDAEHSPGDYTAAIAFDKANGQAVVFNRGITWIWDGARWFSRLGTTNPPSLLQHAMAYDELRERVVVFGGWELASGFDFNETWIWDGANWTKSLPATSPSGRYRAAMAFDAIRGQLVLFGGRSLSGSAFTETWVYPSNNIVATNGTPQFAAPGSPFPQPLEVTVTDILGSPVDGNVVTFQADASLVGLSSPTAITGPDGKAQVTATATAVVAGHVVMATIAEGGSANFNLTNASSAAGSITPAVGSSPQSTSVHQPFVTTLSVIVQDGAGNPSAGATVTFTAPGAGASGVFGNASVTTQAVTDANGIATPAAFRANATAGIYRVTASASGRPDAIFALTNRRGPAMLMTATPGSTPQSAAIGQAYAVPLAVSITDVDHNPAAGLKVFFIAPSSGASGLFANSTTTTSAFTGSNGIATALAFTGKTSPGVPYKVGALSIGLTDVGFSLTNSGTAGVGVSWGVKTQKSPVGLYKIGLAPDATGRLILPGGGGSLGFADGRGWLWDGSNWSTESGAYLPDLPRFGYAVAFDAARGKVVLFGGLDRASGGQSDKPPYDDTFEWDGVAWTKKNPAQRPPAQFGHAMAYDAARGQVVMFGGGQTWTWDGTNWTQKSPASSPPAQSWHGMAYDAARAQVVVYGGIDGNFDTVRQTWVWNGTTWTKKTPATTPPDFFSFSVAMAYDAARAQTVLFGGTETWVWNGTNWTKKTPQASPTQRNYYAMAYDAARGQVVLHGGSTGIPVPPAGVLTDTWTWDGTNWVQRGGGDSSPSGRSFTAMAPAPTAGQLVLFSGTKQQDTWVWDGSKWTLKTPPLSPLARTYHAMAFDEARNQTVLFGGQGGGSNSECFSTCSDGTWVWNGTTWTKKTPAFSPPGQTALAMAYDAARQQVVLFGQRTFGTVGNTFTWDGTNWTQHAPATIPPFRANPSLAYDAARQVVVLFGGAVASGYLNDTWTWDGTTWTQKFPALSPPGQTGQQMTYDAARQRIVLFGQYDAGTWTYDGATWTQQLPAMAPSSRIGHAIAYDSLRAQTVLFGGTSNYVEGFNDTWVYPAAVMTAIAGTPQFALPGQPFAVALTVKVVDDQNVPQAGVVVTFAASPFGASGTFANASIATTTTTAANGIANATTFTANATAGPHIVTASALGQSVAFALNNGSAPPAFALNVSRTGTGTGTVTGIGINCGADCTESYVSGTNASITATPIANTLGGTYTFAGWGGDCTSFGASPTCTLTMTAAKNAIATFSYTGFGSAYSRDYVQKVYVAYYGRPADPAGHGYWAARMDAEGQSLGAIIGAFGNSDEFNRRYGGLDTASLITKIYQQTLGRDPDLPGLAYYVGEVQAGRKTLQTITLDVLNGATTPPDSTVVANRLDVAAYYTAKVAAGCAYGSEDDGVNSLSGVTASAATVTAAKAAINTRCGP